MQLSTNFYKLLCYVSNFIYNTFLANFGMPQSLPFLMNMIRSIYGYSVSLLDVQTCFGETINIIA